MYVYLPIYLSVCVSVCLYDDRLTVPITDSRVLNEELQEKNMINFLINLVVSDQLTYQHAQQVIAFLLANIVNFS